MVGNTSGQVERTLGRIIAPYLSDPSTAFVISSDFAHWGQRFRYTHYQPPSGPAISLSRNSQASKDRSIHESIRIVDFQCIDACESGSHEEWLAALDETGNTVCGRHPIGVVMAAIEEVRGPHPDGAERGLFKFVRYERSSKVKSVHDSSVSYASAFAVV